MTPMTVAMMMFTALSLIESASMPASLSFRTAEAIHKAAAVSVAPKASPETMDVAFLVVAAVAEYRGACVGLDAVGACLAAARCSVIDENELGGPKTCGDAIAGRVYSV